MENLLRTFVGRRLTKSGKIASWKKSLVVPKLVMSDQFFAVESTILYNVLPQTNSLAGLTDTAARLYLLWLYRASLKTNHAYPGPKDARETLGLKKDEYAVAIQELTSKGFLKKSVCCRSNDHGGYCHDVLLVPLYDSMTNTYIINPNNRPTIYCRDSNSFVMVPNLLIAHDWLKRDSLSLTALKVLLKLYEHNDLERFGGVNPAKLSGDVGTGSYKICPLLSEDINIGEKQILKSIKGLLAKGLIQLSLAMVSRYKLMQEIVYRYQCDQQFQGNYLPNSNVTKMVVIRPTYQFKEHIQQWLDDLRKRGCDVSAAKNTIYPC